MIWLFKVNEVFWNNKPKVDKYYVIDTEDINFDINQYNISLYFATASYFLLNEFNNDEIYYLRYNGNTNPIRVLLDKSDEYYKVIQNFYLDNKK
jgi:hypothetical protein